MLQGLMNGYLPFVELGFIGLDILNKPGILIGAGFYFLTMNFRQSAFR